MCTGEVLRTLQISGRSDLSGGPILMTRLLQGLSEHGFEHLVVCPDRPEGVNGILAKATNVRLLNLPLRELRTQNPYSLLRAAQQFRPSLIHSHGKAAGLYSRALGKCLRIPVIHHYHGLHYRQYSAWKRAAYLWTERNLAKVTDRIICVSESEREEAGQLRLAEERQWVVIPNGVDTQQFRPRPELRPPMRTQLGIPETAFVVWCTMRNDHMKHPELALTLQGLLTTSNPEAFFVIAGMDDTDLDSFERQGVSLRRSHIRVLKDKTNLHEWLNIADCYLNTSRWEGLSLGLLEAMATGLPAVLSDVTGNQEVAPLQGNGVRLVHPNHTDGYLKNLKIFSDSKRQCHSEGARCREYVESHFNTTMMIQSITLLYQTIADSVENRKT